MQIDELVIKQKAIIAQIIIHSMMASPVKISMFKFICRFSHGKPSSDLNFMMEMKLIEIKSHETSGRCDHDA